MVRFVGPTRFADGEWIGIELCDPLGNHNGSVNGIDYFHCSARRGIFVRANKPDGNHDVPLP
ncbi:hypothetical protein SPRG_04397 [Saprolegnia parasitica CBS 223.65]|uniref:CAP-Gly domain-containing protein n=1 Tax=Saprolegnia parasitica (strain CBS 223.65) TaxID=695850 RepID=A0A067CMN1_SAPPC|nr:hypothetical protein SPRG_04397 [Saprolegnia parasitica CBS 223.65]KDO30495.1 hypothetical protein SPRG_04397 [Saprolegnia parasitica CBS 223.65]|eukprot:XP_012198713.1 hypothetical protein SPRG_04397 [Saprolegnia parasitica CBS 223.65]